MVAYSGSLKLAFSFIFIHYLISGNMSCACHCWKTTKKAQVKCSSALSPVSDSQFFIALPRFSLYLFLRCLPFLEVQLSCIQSLSLSLSMPFLLTFWVLHDFSAPGTLLLETTLSALRYHQSASSQISFHINWSLHTVVYTF